MSIHYSTVVAQFQFIRLCEHFAEEKKSPKVLQIRITSTRTHLFSHHPLLYHLLLQISTATGIISHFVNLQVVVPEAFILGSGELHVDMGSAINLVCIIEKVKKRMHRTFIIESKKGHGLGQDFSDINLWWSLSSVRTCVWCFLDLNANTKDWANKKGGFQWSVTFNLFFFRCDFHIY